MLLSTTFIALASLLGSAQAANYRRTESVVGTQFNNWFDYQNIRDPTNGRVNYVDRNTAINNNLTWGGGDTFILRTDPNNVVQSWEAGRMSVRIRSKRMFTTHVGIFDVRHMPEGPATWPALWETLEAGWPNGGELDIIEGVNDQGPNAATLHTTAGCTMPAHAANGMTGTWKQMDCNWLINGNAGCGAYMREQRSYGPAFNRNGGGTFGVERAPNYMKVWFWPRGAQLPGDIGSGNVNPDLWGAPEVYFPDTQCNLREKFSANHIIINLTLCGDWAGAVYPGGPQACINHVNNNPAAFRNAFWDIKSINIYEP